MSSIFTRFRTSCFQRARFDDDHPHNLACEHHLGILIGDSVEGRNVTPTRFAFVMRRLDPALKSSPMRSSPSEAHAVDESDVARTISSEQQVSEQAAMDGVQAR